MATYILLMKLTPAGRLQALENPSSVLSAENSVNAPDVRLLGLYAVLGPYDFVGIIEAPHNEEAARFSIKLGAKAGVEIVTMPTIPAMRLEGALLGDAPDLETGLTQLPPT